MPRKINLPSNQSLEKLFYVKDGLLYRKEIDKSVKKLPNQWNKKARQGEHIKDDAVFFNLDGLKTQIRVSTIIKAMTDGAEAAKEQHEKQTKERFKASRWGIFECGATYHSKNKLTLSELLKNAKTKPLPIDYYIDNLIDGNYTLEGDHD
mgnify:CR=1 FL=1